MKSVALLCLVGVLSLSGTVQAAVLFDDFNSYANQAAFQAAWPSFAANGSSMELVNGNGWPQPPTGEQCVRRPTGPGYANTNINYRLLPQVMKPRANAPVTFEYDLYDSGGATQFNREFCSLRAYSGGSANAPWFPANATDTSSLVSMISIGAYYANNPTWMARIYSAGSQQTDGLTFQAPQINGGVPTANPTGWFNLNTARPGMSGSTKPSGWTHLKVVISTTGVDFYVDNVLDTHVAVTNGDKWLGFDGVVLGSGVTTNANMLIDNMSVMPEPVTLAMLGCASLLLRKRRLVQ